jgi:hypothetical protein
VKDTPNEGGGGGVKPSRWTWHALDNLADREIPRPEAEKTLADPEFNVPDQAPRRVLMRRYFDEILNQETLLRLVIEDTPVERVVVTVYKTSQIDKYLRGQKP